jgi:predicted ATPase
VLIGAYRDHEVDLADPLMVSIDQMKREGAKKISTIALSPISLASITQLVADTLHCEIAVVAELAQLGASENRRQSLLCD